MISRFEIYPESRMQERLDNESVILHGKYHLVHHQTSVASRSMGSTLCGGGCFVPREVGSEGIESSEFGQGEARCLSFYGSFH